MAVKYTHPETGDLLTFPVDAVQGTEAVVSRERPNTEKVLTLLDAEGPFYIGMSDFRGFTDAISDIIFQAPGEATMPLLLHAKAARAEVDAADAGTLSGNTTLTVEDDDTIVIRIVGMPEGVVHFIPDVQRRNGEVRVGKVDESSASVQEKADERWENAGLRS